MYEFKGVGHDGRVAFPGAFATNTVEHVGECFAGVTVDVVEDMDVVLTVSKTLTFDIYPGVVTLFACFDVPAWYVTMNDTLTHNVGIRYILKELVALLDDFYTMLHQFWTHVEFIFPARVTGRVFTIEFTF